MIKRKTIHWLQAPCPCGRQSPQHKPLTGAECCGPYLEHFEEVPAPDAESLMRSRYTAFVLGRTAYLLATWLPAQRPQQLQAGQGPQWIGLNVRDHVQPDADHAEVEFVARYRENGRAGRLHERSRFVRLQEGALWRWFYVDGDIL